MTRLSVSTVDLDDLPRVLTPAEAAPFLRYSTSFVYRLIANGSLDHICVVIGPRKRISRELLRRFLDGTLESEAS
jgi:excisionase family DNA binding protein